MNGAERAFRAITDRIVERPRTVVVACLLLTLCFAPGTALLESEAGSDQFTEGIEEADALDRVNEQFEPAFGDDEPTTQLIQRDGNVLDRGGLLAMLTAAERIEERDDLRVSEVSAPAIDVASEIDGDVETAADARDVVEDASEGEIDDAVDAAAEDSGFDTLLSDDFNRESGTASASIGVVTHSFPASADTQTLQPEAREVAEGAPGDVTAFGGGIVDAEFARVIFDSLAIVVPAALAVILGLLAYAYRDPFDFALGGIALLMTVVWTFGFTGYAGIAFSDVLIAVPVLLLAVGIDFGIHTVNRYREERVTGSDPGVAMRDALGQLVVAYSIIAGTTIIGFLANLTSSLDPLREFGIVAGVGICFTLVIFVGFLPAAKLLVDRWRAANSIPAFGSRPLGSADSALGRLLPRLSALSRPAPAAFLVVVLLLTAGAAGYGAGVDTTFDDDDFLPPSEQPGYVDYFPAALQPGEYTATETIDFLSENFATSEDDTVTIYVERRMTSDAALRSLSRAERDPPETFIETDGRASATGVDDAIDGYAEEDTEFAGLVADSSLDDGPPNRNLERIYGELRDSEYEGFTGEYLADDDRSTRVVYDVESDASDAAVTADARDVADRYRGDATATGQIVVFQAVAETIFDSAIVSLAAALGLSALFLVVLFWLFLDSPTLGLVTLLPVAVTVATLTTAMRLAGIPFNALTATILAITIGLGVDYTVHVAHRFHDEYAATDDVDAAVVTTLRGTGGALTGTMATTAFGTGVLVLAITPILGQFGLLTAVSISLAYLASLVVLPPALVAWVAAVERRPELLWIGRAVRGVDADGGEAERRGSRQTD
ncbi:MMPL family transporter [Halorubrum sp. AD140]|uniref:efflux RND transporter permease subunit n=1 Tax=Halorubrum sp. AD140 TaxID=3050073 RepID=UPI002ACC9548|nr:MMPL family transporter [Halorubrum sp. AD140]MDZ5811386.1 MMPL family transporter [Halorubrum sp. AD140]